MVNELFLPGTKIWNEVLIEDSFKPKDAVEILKLPTTQALKPDLWGWNYTTSGIYTVKSGYWLNTHLPNQARIVPPHGDTYMKSRIWKTQTAPKLRHFLWRILSKALAVSSILKHRRIIQDSTCRRCNKEEETLDHLFFRCEYAKAIWECSYIMNTIVINNSSSSESNLRMILDHYQNHTLSDLKRQLPFWILWRIWKSRNLLLYQKQSSNWEEDVIKADKEATEWLDDCGPMKNKTVTMTSFCRPTMSQWTIPQEGYIKCNYDCRFRQDEIKSGMAWIIRDSNGTYLEAGHSMGRVCNSPLEAELQALLMISIHVWSRGYRRVIFEGDNKTVRELMNGTQTNFGVHTLITNIQYWQAKLEYAENGWVSRQSNQVADRLAKELDHNPLFLLYNYVPRFLDQLLHCDYTTSMK